MDPIHFISKPFFMKNVVISKVKDIFFFLMIILYVYCLMTLDFMIDLGHNFTT